MKRLLPLVFSVLAAGSAYAQHGATPESGHNPVDPLTTAHSTGPLSPMDGNATLGPTYAFSACGLNYTTATQKIGQRFSPVGVPQPATFAIAGIPATAVIQQAFVWCDASGNGIPITITVANPFTTSASFPMTMIGQDQDKCWGYQGTYSYRADVTSIIAGNGNYTISGFPTGSTNDVDGATLMIIWSDPTASYQGDINIWDGCVVINGGTTTQTINNMSACTGTIQSARAFTCIADLQGLGSQITLNGMPPIGVTEDWWNYVDVSTTVTPGQATSTFGNNSSGDCYNFCVMGLYWRSNCTTCCANPFTLNMTSSPSQCTSSNGTATATPVGGSGPFSYTWNTPSSDSTQTANGLPPGIYTVSVQDSMGCTTVDSILVSGQGSLASNPSQTDVTCHGGNNGSCSIVVAGGTGPFTYTWTPNVSTTSSASSLTAGTYVVDVADNYGCQTSYTFNITEPALIPIVGTVTGTSPICWGFASQLSVSATGGAPPYSYQWLTGLGNNDTITVSPAITTTYSVVINDVCNTPADTATFTVVVNQPPVIGLSGDDLAGCMPLCVNFTAQSNPASVSTSWNFGDNTTGTGDTILHCYYFNGTYDVSIHVKDINGCLDSLTLPNYIDVYPFPVAGFSVTNNDHITKLEANVLFDDVSSGGDTCYWDFGDGHTIVVPGCDDVAHDYADTGVYHVQQIVVNQWGCEDTLDYDVVIVPYTTLFIPNTFTPNGDGKNDVFMPVGQFVADFHMMIFDRWGNLIYETNDQSMGWDGHANGGNEKAQIDTYVYVVTFHEMYTGNYHRIIGNVNLIR